MMGLAWTLFYMHCEGAMLMPRGVSLVTRNVFTIASIES